MKNNRTKAAQTYEFSVMLTILSRAIEQSGKVSMSINDTPINQASGAGLMSQTVVNTSTTRGTR